MAGAPRNREKLLEWYTQRDFRGGINYEIEEAGPNQLADARNVWARKGSLEQRPGYAWVNNTNNTVEWWSESGAANIKNLDIVKYDDSTSTYTTYAGGVPVTFDAHVGDIFYAGSATIDDANAGDGFTAPWNTIYWLDQVTNNTTNTRVIAEYWNGTTWNTLPFVSMPDGFAGTFRKTSKFWPGEPLLNGIIFSPQPDWAQTTVEGLTKYWLRFTMTDTSAASASPGGVAVYAGTMNLQQLAAMALIPWAGQGYTIATYLHGTGAFHYTVTATNMGPSISNPATSSFGFESVGVSTTFEPPVPAVVPEYGEAYVPIGQTARVIRRGDITGIPTGETISTISTVENRDAFVGPNAQADKAVVLQSPTWPTARYTLWHNNRLFAAHMYDDPYGIQWSMANTANFIGYKVWPDVSKTFILGGDQSPITGLTVFGEHPLVFKQNSLWRMIFTGTDVSGLAVYAPARVDQGVGCISNSSIQSTPAGLVYAAEDGIYAFDGVRSQKVSRAIDQLWNTLNRGGRNKWVATHWRREHVYMLAVSTADSNVNNLVLVWDYANDSWWVWDNIEAVAWVKEDDGFGDEKIYFADQWCNIYQFGDTDDDNGAATEAYILTHRLGFKDDWDKRFRAVLVSNTNEAKTLSTALIVNDATVYPSGAMTFKDAAEPLPEVFELDEDEPTGVKRRQAVLHFRKDGNFAQVRVENTALHCKLNINQIGVGFYRKGTI